jgi:hypothetical protein
MKVLKSKHLNVLERLYTYKTTKCKTIMNEQHVEESNALFDLALKYEKTD